MTFLLTSIFSFLTGNPLRKLPVAAIRISGDQIADSSEESSTTPPVKNNSSTSSIPAEEQCTDILKDFVVINKPITRCDELFIEKSSAAVSEENICYRPSGEEVVAVDINAFIQDLDRTFQPQTPCLPAKRIELGWERITKQFQRDLPREVLTINNQVYTSPEEAIEVIKSLTATDKDAQIIIMFAQQCAVALPYEVVSLRHSNSEKGMYLAELKTKPQPHKRSGEVIPNSLCISVKSDAKRKCCSVRIVKHFRVFAFDENGSDRTTTTIEMIMDCDIPSKNDVLLRWIWKPYLPEPSETPTIGR